MYLKIEKKPREEKKSFFFISNVTFNCLEKIKTKNNLKFKEERSKNEKKEEGNKGLGKVQ